MSKRKDSMKNELQEKIAAFQQEALPNIPPAIYDQLQKHIAELVQSGVAQEYRAFYKSIGLDLPAYNGDDSYELPMPGTFVVAKNGTIQLAQVDADFTERLEPAAIIECLQILQEPV